jgi:hypothetical protein
LISINNFNAGARTYPDSENSCGTNTNGLGFGCH